MTATSSRACGPVLKHTSAFLNHCICPPAVPLQEAAKAEADHKQAALDALQQELGAAHAECAGLAAGKQQREAELVGRLEAMQRECGALLGVVERAEEQVTEVGLLGRGGGGRCAL